MKKMTCASLGLALALALVAPPAARAQTREPTTGDLLLGGLGLGAIGYLSGVYLGRRLEAIIVCPGGTTRCEPSGIGELVLAVAGGSTGIAAGVHLANDQRGNFGREWLYSLGIGALGAGAVITLAGELLPPYEETTTGQQMGLTTAYFVVVPAIQLLTMVYMERHAEGADSGQPASAVMINVRIPVR